MSSLLAHQHRSTSDRLLNNYLSSQKQLTTALLTLLSHSHSSTSSLLAYVTSSSGVSYPVRRSVQNAAFEGPINSDQLYSGGDDVRSLNSNGGGNGPEAKWHVYISSLEKFRKELKEVHQLEEELSQVKRDREILVSRLIKATKSRPTKADIAAAASDSGSRRNRDSHNGSVLSFGSDGSGTTAGGAGRSKRAEKLAEAQAEVLGCEEHLRSLEVRLEEERNKVMRHGLMERFRAMEDVGRMWQHQARLGMAELERPNGPDGPLLPPNAYEVDSNSSLAPSHSASQVGYGSDGEVEQRRPRGNNGNKNHGRGGRVPGMGGSVTGSIAEEDEGSSSDDGGNLVVHENKRPGLAGMENTIAARSQSTIVPNGGGDNRRGGAGQGVPSITAIRAKPPTQRQHSGSSSSSGGGGGRRRTQSELGYHPPRARQQNRMSLRRTYSGGAKSDDSSVRGGQTGKKKGGFFRSLARLFKTKPGGGSTVSNNRPKAGRRGSDSPPLGQRNRSGWSTRTDTNIKRASSTSFGSRGGVGGRRRDDDGSSSDEGYSGGLVAVTNRGNNTWSVDNVGKVPAPQGKKTRSDLGAGAKGRNNSSSTITPAGQAKTVSKPPAAGSQPVSRSNTVKSNASGVDAKRTRQGSITRARNNALATSPSISSVLGGGPGSAAGKKTGSAAGAPIGSTVTAPKMAEIPKAPKSQVTPQMFMATAPPPTATGLLQPPPTSAPASMDSLVPKKTASSVSRSTITPAQTAPAPAKEVAKPIAKPAALPPKSASRPASKQLAGLDLGAPIGMTQENPSIDSFMQRTSTPLPPSKTLSPPAKSAFRAASPQPPSSPVNEIPQPAFLVSAPGSSIQAKKEEPVVEKPVERPAEVIKQHEAPAYQDRPETPMTMTEENESIYESAVEEDAVDGESPAKPKTRAVRGYGIDADDASSVASESTASPGDAGRYKVVENTEGLAARLKQVGGERSRPVESVGAPPTPPEPAPEPMQDVVAPAPASVVESGVERRKSVRMNVPDSPAPTPSAEQVTFPSRVNGNADGGWSSRVGKGGDSSEEEDNAAYAKAKRNLQRFSSLSATTSPAKKTKRKSKA